jgi:hypothetical protein
MIKKLILKKIMLMKINKQSKLLKINIRNKK